MSWDQTFSILSGSSLPEILCDSGAQNATQSRYSDLHRLWWDPYPSTPETQLDSRLRSSDAFVALQLHRSTSFKAMAAKATETFPF